MILCLNVSGIREDWDCDTFDLLLIIVRLVDPGQQGSKLHVQLHFFTVHRAKLFRRGGAN